MANNPTSLAAAQVGQFSTPQMTYGIVDIFDFVHMPDVFRTLVQKYPNEFADIMWMYEEGMTEQCFNNTPNWQEDIRKLAPITIATIAQAPGSTAGNPNTNAIRLTIAASSHYQSGTYTYPIVGEVVEFANGVQGYIYNKNTASANAHYIDISPLRNVTQSYATFSSGIFAGQQFAAKGLIKAEGVAGNSQSRIGRPVTFYSQIERATEYFSVTADEITTKNWIDYEGYGGKNFWHWNLGITLNRLFAMRELSLFTGQTQLGSTDVPVDENGLAINTTEGLIPTLENRGAQSLSTGAAISWEFFEEAARIFQKNHSGQTARMLTSTNVDFKIARFLASMSINVNTDPGSEKMVNQTFKKFSLSGYDWEWKRLNIFSHDATTAIAGARYPDYSVIMPTSKATINVGGDLVNVQGKSVAPFTMLYKNLGAATGTANGKGDYLMIPGGGLAPKPLDQTDTYNVKLHTHFAARTTRAGEMILVTP